MVKSIVKFCTKKYLRGIINDLLAKLGTKCDLMKVTHTVEVYTGKLESLISFFKDLNMKISDANITEEEMTDLEKKSETLIQEIVS